MFCMGLLSGGGCEKEIKTDRLGMKRSVQTVDKAFALQETMICLTALGDVGPQPLEIRWPKGDMCGRRPPIHFCLQGLCIFDAQILHFRSQTAGLGAIRTEAVSSCFRF